MRTRSGRVIHAIAGAGPLSFLAIATVEGLARADYDPIAQPISALALGPRGWIQTLNFGILAASLFTLAIVLRAQFRGGARAAVVPGVFVVMTIGMVISTIYPMDATGAPPTLEGKLHVVGGFLIFPWIPIALGVTARQFRTSAHWQRYVWPTAVLAVLSLATIVGFLVFVGPPGSPRRYAELAGAVQRVQLFPFFVWIAAVARRASQHPQPVTVAAARGDIVGISDAI